MSANLLFNMLKNHPNEVDHILSASAIGIYPTSLTATYQEEFSDFDNSFLSNVVVKWEESVSQFERLNIKVSKIRIGLVLATRSGALPQMVKPIQNYIGAPFGSGKQFQSWIHIHDLAALFFFVLEQKLAGVFNAVAPNPVTNSKLVETIAEIIEKPILMPNIPRFMMKLILGEMHVLLFDSQNVSSRKIEKAGFDFQYKSIFSALQQLLQK